MIGLSSVTVTLAPLAFGLTAWVLAALWGFSRKKRSLYLPLSWCACACALWFPLYSIYQWVEAEDIIAILDCTHAYLVCATVLLTVNLFLFLLGMFLKWKRERSM